MHGLPPSYVLNHARATMQVLDMIEHGFAKRGINLTTLPARLLYRSAYVVLISFVACTIPFFGVRAAAAARLARCVWCQARKSTASTKCLMAATSLLRSL